MESSLWPQPSENPARRFRIVTPTGILLPLSFHPRIAETVEAIHFPGFDL
jgi:hypothetical protein